MVLVRLITFLVRDQQLYTVTSVFIIPLFCRWVIGINTADGEAALKRLGRALYEAACQFYVEDARRRVAVHNERRNPAPPMSARVAFKVCHQLSGPSVQSCAIVAAALALNFFLFPFQLGMKLTCHRATNSDYDGQCAGHNAKHCRSMTF